jgi:tetratricopeptide (TPR) repeat protein
VSDQGTGGVLDDGQRLSKAVRLYKEGQFDAALAALDAIETPDLSLAKHYHKGLALARLGHLEAALAEFRNIKEIPTHVKGYDSGSFLQAYYASLAAVLHQLANTKGTPLLHDAISCYEYALELNKKDTRVLHGLGVAYMELGLVNHAIPLLEKAVALDPGSAEAKAALEQAWKMSKDSGSK